MEYNFYTQYKQKMMIDSSSDVSQKIQTRVTSPNKKENAPIPLFLTTSTPPFKPNHLHPHPQLPQRILQNNWLNVTTKQPNPPTFTKVLSPKSFYTTTSVISPKQTRIIELGGSKQKRESRQRNFQSSEAETQRNQLPANDVLSRRVSMLESRVKQLHMQKQQLAIDLNQRNKALQSENQRLNSLIKCLQQGKTATAPTPNQDEFDLEEQLAKQININLELRQELETVKRDMDELKQKYTQQNIQFNTVSQENASIKLQFVQLQDSSQDQILQLQQEIAKMTLSLSQKQTSTIQIIQERQKRIFELEDQSFTLSNKVQQQQRQNQGLNEQISSLSSQLNSQKHQVSTFKSRIEELEKPVECKKCKQLLHTVFRLNSQLNRK